jgi:hypothetical protein
MWAHVRAGITAIAAVALMDACSAGDRVPTAAAPVSSAATASKVSSHLEALFAPGANVCESIDTAALDKAVGIAFSPGTWDGHLCDWEADGGKEWINISVRLDVTPTVLAQLKSLDGNNGINMREVAVPGASAALLQTVEVPTSLPSMPGQQTILIRGGGINRVLTAVFQGTDALTVSLSAPDATVAQVVAAAGVATG